MKRMFNENRKRFIKKLEDGDLLILLSESEKTERGDTRYPYSPQRNFYYLTGIARPGLALTIAKTGGEVSEKLYLRRFDAYMAKWVGAELMPEEAKNISGIDNAGSYMDELDGYVAGLLTRGFVKRVFIDLENSSLSEPVSENVAYANRIKAAYPAVKIADAYPVFGSLRSSKSKQELGCIRDAANAADAAFKDVLKRVKPDMYEYEIEAIIGYNFRKRGMSHAFAPIVAGGANAAVLHYTDNTAKIADGSLVLMDFGARSEWYCADVTRTFPINGKFTERQRLLYDIVLRGNEYIISRVKSGETLKGLNDALKDYYVKELKAIGLIENKKRLGDYYYHGVSHPLGLEPHDCGRGVGMPEELAPGAVITVEPGLYIAEEGIGIRIEDDVVVTEKGCEVLTAGIIKSADEIEGFMAKR